MTQGRGWYWATLALGVVLLCLPSAGSTGEAGIGFFVNSPNTAAVTAVASKLGVKASVVTWYAYPDAAGNKWRTLSKMPPYAGLQLLLGVGAVTPAQATALGTYLVSAGYSDSILRIMWEMNGNWQPWGTQALSAAQYIAIYRAAEKAFAAVPGNHFHYVWDVNAGTVEPGRTEFDTYPGNAYVSSIGVDYYCYNPSTHDGAPESALPPILAFAAAHGKTVQIDEWGLNGVDDPACIDFLFSVVHNPANHVTLQSYFSWGTNDITRFPRSEAEYRMDFSGN